MKKHFYYFRLIGFFLSFTIFVSCGQKHTPEAEEDETVEGEDIVNSSEEMSADEVLKLEGKIGTYSVEMEILSSDREKGEIEGKYRYTNKKNYLDIRGKIYGHCLHIEEFYNKKQTGSFFLEKDGKNLSGKWVHDRSVYDVNLNVTQGNAMMLEAITDAERSKKTNSKLSGTYKTGGYYINDFFVTEDNPHYEIGFDGGTVTFKEAGKDQLQFSLLVIAGPTAHVAEAQGIAVRQREEYIYTNDDGCLITFRFSDRRVLAFAESSADCGFGARAFLDHEFIKISDE